MINFLPVPPEVPGIGARALVAVAFTAAAAYFDVFNRKWVPNYLVYGFLVAAVLLNIVFYSPEASAQAIAIGAAVFLLTYPLYRMGQLGGADVFVLAAIAASIPYFSTPLLAPQQPIQYPFILSVLVPSSLFFILHMLARFLPYAAQLLREGKLKLTGAKTLGPLLLVGSFSLFAYAAGTLPIALPPQYLFIMSFLLVSLAFFSFFKEEIKGSMVEPVPPSSLAEEDVLALEKMDQGTVKRLGLKPLLTAKSIAAIKKARLKSVPVYTGMPFFLPYLLLGLAFTLLFGDLLYSLVLL
jgi:Flp pilus assembly protein protease CpaA